MVLSRNLVRLMLGLSLLTTAVNLILFQAGRMESVQPPLIQENAQQLGASADPIPQALVLTAIVIGFALTVILASLALRAYRGHGTLRSDEIQSAEPPGAKSVERRRDVR
jgi:multicomponent Na+:H+ antiporter subunit C